MLSQSVQFFKPEFNRRARQWQTKDGATFPAGQQGHNAARLAAIVEANSELADKIVELGTDDGLFRRLLDAGELILNGNVYSDHVKSQADENRYYTVGYRWGGYTCNCDGFHYQPLTMEGVGLVCKHCLAVHLCYLLQIATDPAPIPFKGETLNFDEIPY